MAVTVLPANSMAESVKLAVRSTTSCSEATVLSLQTLLHASSKPIRKNTKTAKETPTPASRSRASRSTKTKTASEAALIVEQESPALSPQDKLVLATEVFNTTLKTLTDASKTPATKRHANPDDNASVKSGKTNVSDVDLGIISAAECARLALSSLRTLKNDQQSPSSLNMQLDQGVCVLAGRLIALGLNDLACKELRSLKRRIQQHLNTKKSSENGTESQEASDEDLKKERMSDLLTFSNIANAQALYGLLVPFQSNVMRLFAAEKRSSTVENLCPLLQLSDPSSPAQIILTAFKFGSLAADKAALQLQLLSNAVLSLASRQSASDDSSMSAKTDLKPITSLSLQLLSLEIRCLGWKLAGHVCDETKEVSEPLFRHLGNFSQRSKGIEKTDFVTIYKIINRIQSTMTEVRRKSRGVKDATSGARLMSILGQLAFDAGCFEESLKLFNQAIGPFSDAQSLSLAAVRCKIASVYFHTLRRSTKLLEEALIPISEATEALGLQLKGSANDLDEVLVEAARLKKLALAWFGDAMTNKINTDGKKNEFASPLREYLQAFLKFLRRYVGRSPENNSDGNELEMFCTRVNTSKNIVLAAVDSTVALGKLSIMSQKPPWDDMLPIFSDCHRLLGTMESHHGESTDTSLRESIGKCLVKLSNLLWSCYIKEKEAGHGYRELIPLLKQSTQFLAHCTSADRTAAFAALKFERLAYLYLDQSLFGDSEKAFRQSIAEYISSGTLEQLAESMPGTQPSLASQDSQSPGFMLGRVISSLLKMKLRRKGSKGTSIYDDPALKPEQRGMILEWQLGLLCDLREYCSSEEDFRLILEPVVSSILDIYDPDIYPIRRGRVTLTLLRFLLEHPNALDSTLTEKIIQGGLDLVRHKKYAEDEAYLAPFAQHMTNSLRAIITFHQGGMNPGELDDILASWTSMLRQCTDGETLLLRIHDFDYWLLQLKALVDYTEIHGLWQSQLCTLELILRAAELRQFADLSDAITILSRLVFQHCRLGHCQKAGELLSRGDSYLAQREVSSLARLSYKLARVEFLLETGGTDKAVALFSAAQSLYEEAKKTDELSNLTVQSKISWERLVADAAYIQSRLSTAQGSMTHALYFAKLSVRLNCRIWAKVEKLAQKKNNRSLPAAETSDVEAIAEGVARLDLSQGSSPGVSASYTQGAPFWPHLGSHHTCLLNLATLSAHHGLFQDAIYYGEQALKIDRTLDANIRLIAAQTQIGYNWILGGHVDEGQEVLTAALGSSKQIQTSIETVALHIALASLYKTQGQHSKAHRLLQDAGKAITIITSPDATNIVSETSDSTGLEENMEKLNIRSTRRKLPTTAEITASRRTRGASSASSSTKKTPASKSAASDVQSKSLLRLRSEVLRQQADCLRSMREFERSSHALTEARQFAVARESKVSLEIGESEHLLADAIRHFASHAVYCVLPESTISLPSLKSPIKAADETSNHGARLATRKTKQPARGARMKAQRASEDFSAMLSRASDCLTTVFADATVLGSTLESHAASRLMSRISMLSHATNPGGPATWAQSPANMNEIGRVGAFARERMAIDFDRQLANFADPLLWPASSPTALELDKGMCTNFSKNYIDILPENWNVLSLSLSADRTEFVVSRLQKDRSPFLLRLPLRRGTSDDDEEEQFTFEDGKKEMQDLINQANESAHAAKAQTDKASKKEWWKNREALDRRMESLLQNIENVWFGGFRGVFSPLSRDSNALAKFASAFEGILDKHLPSRQKGGKASSPRLTLHQNVVELFIGLRDLEQQEEPEDTLMDLLYFVVDILQFQGERNAYDEIDFDMMVVDTLDALRSYHNASREEHATRLPSHTVLVLDKTLHLFPWESLPCLQGFPVCRVPSLECLRHRVLQFRESRSGAIVDRASGAFILNPTGDLRTTQTTFEEDLSVQKSWTGVVKREPTEDEFRNSLESKDLFLYFGHGSGAQYIRGRTVKRLTKCAVAFLMGCSSGTLTEAGEYEPYGTPMNYLHAGSPALVATLWDVTDKDIDRFSTSTFDTWGLLGKKSKTQTQTGDVGLDTAVAGARGSCILKYLNGAAPVVYGVPVFLG